MDFVKARKPTPEEKEQDLRLELRKVATTFRGGKIPLEHHATILDRMGRLFPELGDSRIAGVFYAMDNLLEYEGEKQKDDLYPPGEDPRTAKPPARVLPRVMVTNQQFKVIREVLIHAMPKHDQAYELNFSALARKYPELAAGKQDAEKTRPLIYQAVCALLTKGVLAKPGKGPFHKWGKVGSITVCDDLAEANRAPVYRIDDLLAGKVSFSGDGGVPDARKKPEPSPEPQPAPVPGPPARGGVAPISLKPMELYELVDKAGLVHFRRGVHARRLIVWQRIDPATYTIKRGDVQKIIQAIKAKGLTIDEPKVVVDAAVLRNLKYYLEDPEKREQFNSRLEQNPSLGGLSLVKACKEVGVETLEELQELRLEQEKREKVEPPVPGETGADEPAETREDGFTSFWQESFRIAEMAISQGKTKEAGLLLQRLGELCLKFDEVEEIRAALKT